MRLLYLSLLLCACAPAQAQRATLHDAPLSDRRVSYDIDVRLDPVARTLDGAARITWRNPDRVPVDELQFHLYLNAFKDERSTFMRESGGRHRGYRAGREDAWGSIQITQMHLLPPGGAAGPTSPADLMPRLRFIQPDDGNPHDQTVVSAALPQPVAPGETVTLDVRFEARLPQIFARTGWERKPNGRLFFMVAQWFPKLGVYEVPGQRYVPEEAPHGRWSTHQFHANSEFYADFGTYEVTITVPEDYRVGATGVQVAEAEQEGTRTVTYRAEDVHDFAWTASSDFLEYTDRWRHVDLRLLLQPEHRAQAQRHFDAAKVALEHFDRWVGPYPYTTLTLVDGVGGSNGMEYPTLITCGTVYGLPPWLRALELVTIHEFGHQYFYGLLASNEAEEAWLDEGINSYLEARIMDAAYGPGSVLDVPGLRIGNAALQRILYTKDHPTRSAIYTRSWAYAYPGDYGKATYQKPATVLKTLEQYLGWDVMHQVLRTYYDRWRFRHPTTRDFIAVVEEVSGQELDWFFEAYVYGTHAVDYAVVHIESRAQAAPAGSFGEQTYSSAVVVHQKEQGVFPQTLRVRFEDGSVQERTWDGADVWRTFRFISAAPLAEAYLDPENEVWLDVNRLNNRRVAAPEHLLARKEQLKFIVRLQQFFYLVAALF